MPLPPADRVKYRHNPLAKVIAQVRFPGILTIQTDPPAAFQERIREILPELAERREDVLELGLPEEVARLLPDQFALPGSRVWTFQSKETRWSVGLTKDFLALSDDAYTLWQDFREHLQQPLTALLDVYKPAYLTRIGLRYQNLIDREDLNLKDVPWKHLLASHISGELSNDAIKGEIVNLARELTLKPSDIPGVLNVRHGLVRREHKDGNRIVFLIDADFFTTERKETTDALGVLDAFNHAAFRLFRWCITDQLHHALDPQPIPG